MPRSPKNKSDWTPFDHWWDIYPGFRKKNKEVCRKKFEKHDLDVQRDIYKDTKTRAGHYPDWRDPQYICAPEVYLNQHMWEAPVQAPEPAGTAMPHTDTAQQKAAGLRKLIDAMGGDPELERQLALLITEMNATVVDVESKL